MRQHLAEQFGVHVSSFFGGCGISVCPMVYADGYIATEMASRFLLTRLYFYSNEVAWSTGRNCGLRRV